MELIYVNTPKMRVSNITINTDNDDLSEPEEKWLMSDSVTKLYAEYLMEYK